VDYWSRVNMPVVEIPGVYGKRRCNMYDKSTRPGGVSYTNDAEVTLIRWPF